MTKAERYRQTLSGLSPSPAWRERTLSAMAAAAPARRAHRRPRAGALAACAAALLLLTGAGLLALRLLPTASPGAFPGGILSRDPGYAAPSDLPKLTLSADFAEGMGAFDDTTGLLMVRDPEEQATQNPTLDHTDGITALPVYKNDIPTEAAQLALAERAAGLLGTAVRSHERGEAQSFAYLTAECENGIRLTLHNLISVRVELPESPAAEGKDLETRLAQVYGQLSPLAGFSSPALEVTRDYDFYGEASSWYFWFERDESKPLADRLLDYTFARLGDEFCTDTMEVPFRYFQLPLWPPEEGTLYPIRTAEAAVADFRAGDYLGVDMGTDTENASILHVELVYLTQPYQAYLQPAYRITYTQDYWDESAVMRDAEDPEAYTSVSFAYVPAVAEEYVDILDAAALQCN